MEQFINRSRYFGKALPYDSEVEYLEINEGSEGCPCIDTGIVIDSLEYDFYLEMTFLGYSANNQYLSWFAAYTDEDSACYRIIRDYTSNTSARIYWGHTAGNGGTLINNFVEVGKRYNISFESSKRQLKINENIFYPPSSPSSPNINSMVLGKIRPQGTAGTYQKIYHCKINKNGETILDLIPVRKGNVGYMYDKISNKLFGNVDTSGSNSKFILGPDVTKPYDREVEYLEVNEESGPAWIDTEYVPTGNDINIEMTAILNGYSTSASSIVWYKANSDPKGESYSVTKYLTRELAVYVTNGNPSGCDLWFDAYVWEGGLGHKFGFIINDIGTLKKLGTTTGVSKYLVTDSDIPNTETLKIFTPSEPYAFLKIYSFKLSKANKLVLDLIPVRKDGVGYMYDKVSGKMLGNVNNDGSYFILGPDIIKSHYNEVEYLEVNESNSETDLPYIMTDIILNDGQNYIIESDLTIYGNNKNSNSRVFSNIDTGEDFQTQDLYGLRYALSNDNTALIAYMATSNYLGALRFTKGLKSKWEINGFNHTILLNGVKISITWPTKTDIGNDKPLVLFSSNRDKGITYFRMYNLRISNASGVIHDLVPVRKGDKIGMYDKITYKLYTNSGTGNFIVGPDIN